MLVSNVKSIWLLAIFAISVLSLCHDHHKVAAENCELDISSLNIECMIYMNKGGETLINPNDRCCKAIKSANVPCVCRNLSRKITWPPGATIEDLLNWKRVLHCFNYCGRPLHAGFKCGHFTVPRGPPPSKS